MLQYLVLVTNLKGSSTRMMVHDANVLIPLGLKELVIPHTYFCMISTNSNPMEGASVSAFCVMPVSSKGLSKTNVDRVPAIAQHTGLFVMLPFYLKDIS